MSHSTNQACQEAELSQSSEFPLDSSREVCFLIRTNWLRIFRYIVPNSRMGSVIGKGGSKIKEIQEASGAKLQASEAMLAGSTEVSSL